MSETTVQKKVLRGGAYLVEDSQPADTFIPEEFTEEQLMISDMCQSFLESEIFPNRNKIEKQEDHIAERLLEKMGELGLLNAHIPEAYGGMGLDFNTNTIIADKMGPASSFIVSFAAHVGIGMLPIFYFGTEAQKQKYLPRMGMGQLKASYCLTEPGSGSDALAAKTRADLSPDGTHYVINGQKMWISNAGFADVFIVFAQVGGDKFTGFIIERDSEGLTLGQEEDKMGIKGSSTRQVFFENVKVPVENVLGEIGKGHLIAFNALNIGRYKLGVMSIGGCKSVVTMATKYANERHQFNQAISGFGAIQHKLAEMLIRTFTGESAMYRVSDFMQDAINNNIASGDDYAAAQLKAAEEYAIECAILKVYCSEVLDYCVDENVQVHGGVGFSEEYLAARAYRDARINRIYEGTNEINRLLMIDMLFRRAMKGAFDIVTPAWAVQKELASMPSFDRPEGDYAEEKAALKDFKKIALMTAGSAAKMQMDGSLNLKEEQEIVMNVADMMIEIFNAESLLLRVEKLKGMTQKPQPQEIYDAILKVAFHDATSRIERFAKDALSSFAEGDLLKTFLMGLKRFTKYPPQNVKRLRRQIAGVLIEANENCF